MRRGIDRRSSFYESRRSIMRRGIGRRSRMRKEMNWERDMFELFIPYTEFGGQWGGEGRGGKWDVLSTLSLWDIGMAMAEVESGGNIGPTNLSSEVADYYDVLYENEKDEFIDIGWSFHDWAEEIALANGFEGTMDMRDNIANEDDERWDDWEG